MSGDMMTIAALLALDWHDDGWPVDYLRRLNWALAEAQAGRRAMTGVPCGADGEPAGERRQIPVAELTWLRFPLAVPAGRAFDLFAPPWQRAYMEVAIGDPRVFRDDIGMANAYVTALKGRYGSMGDFMKYVRSFGVKGRNKRLQKVYTDHVLDHITVRRGRPPREQ